MKSIFLVGHRGSGKTYLANKLKEEYELLHIDTGPLIRKNHREKFSEYDFVTWLKHGEKKYGENFSNIVVCKEIENILKNSHIKSDLLIITGNRSMQGIEYIIKEFGIHEFKVIFLDAPFECLKRNYVKRENLNLSDDEFQAIIDVEKNMGISGVKEYTKNNNNNSIYIYRENNASISIDEYKKMINIEEYLKQKEGKVL